MKWLIAIALLLASLGVVGLWLKGQLMPTAEPAALEPVQAEVAEQFMDLIEQANYAAALAMLAPEVRSKLGESELRALWEALPGQLGGEPQRGPARGEKVNGSPVVSFRLDFPALALDARIAVDAAGAVTGFRLVPAARAYVPPPPLPPEAPLIERAVVVRASNGEPLEATLAMPKGEGPFPGVVLVHGSGPHDRDEAIGPNKPFADIARGLAARGVAVLRYDKRAWAHPKELEGRPFTVDDEVTADAVAALAAIRNQDGVDAARVVVAGHSLGGMLAPRIAVADGRLAGVILLAAPALPLEDKVVMQTRYLAQLEGSISAEAEAQIREVEGQRNVIRQLTDEASAPDQLMLNLPARYWLDLRGYDPVDAAVKTNLPLLVVGGGRDYQVDHNDWARWEHALGGNPLATLMLSDAQPPVDDRRGSGATR